jgi:hypothetical protein
LPGRAAEQWRNFDRQEHENPQDAENDGVPAERNDTLGEAVQHQA